jgi:alkylhydroperoxidase family enzyme
MANHAGLLAGLMGGLGSSVYGPGAHITPSQRELAYLTASVSNRCHY